MKLCLRINSASNLPRKNPLDTIDSYVAVDLNSKQNITQSRVIDNEINPFWNQILVIRLDPNEEIKVLRFRVRNCNVFGEDSDIGNCELTDLNLKMYEIVENSLTLNLTEEGSTESKINFDLQYAPIKHDPFKPEGSPEQPPQNVEISLIHENSIDPANFGFFPHRNLFDFNGNNNSFVPPPPFHGNRGFVGGGLNGFSSSSFNNNRFQFNNFPPNPPNRLGTGFGTTFTGTSRNSTLNPNNFNFNFNPVRNTNSPNWAPFPPPPGPARSSSSEDESDDDSDQIQSWRPPTSTRRFQTGEPKFKTTESSELEDDDEDGDSSDDDYNYVDDDNSDDDDGYD
ncbi:C2 domain containing protein [Histomonas meleagridis]|uniref:C2 domain containing protein n=1 Tax=Histomonas meleagridis TaxID=135588 RepID=UPI0035596FA9|nr:C2 domain containing protein [Histomonas meleagridis]KAH0800021.1 C2 domain containing protein [Histomonas meleagridis]